MNVMLKTIKPWNFADFLILSIRWCTKCIYSISFSRFEFKIHRVVTRLGFSSSFTKKKKRTMNCRDFFRDSVSTFVFALCVRKKLCAIKSLKFGDKLNFPWYRCNIHFGPFLFCFVVFSVLDTAQHCSTQAMFCFPFVASSHLAVGFFFGAKLRDFESFYAFSTLDYYSWRSFIFNRWSNNIFKLQLSWGFPPFYLAFTRLGMIARPKIQFRSHFMDFMWNITGELRVFV